MPPESNPPQIDALIHEPARLRVLALLASVEEADFMFILRSTGLSRGNLSVQMTKLENAGLVTLNRRLDGSRARTCYRLSTAGTDALRTYKKTVRQLLDALPD
ncbi:transcriptional regulator [Actomonas aquatica]|uniref:Transcriptional regulator n=1 Tax=Actomonas aquatica TaxID=2866162 RepID=A0ABZ1C279_9BACT|nr:transcriptional regulator [Opitutus sp. WL0086]WRQ85796.1 transcriptional regulator [Opitutus sp. WL0086]